MKAPWSAKGKATQMLGGLAEYPTCFGQQPSAQNTPDREAPMPGIFCCSYPILLSDLLSLCWLSNGSSSFWPVLITLCCNLFPDSRALFPKPHIPCCFQGKHNVTALNCGCRERGTVWWTFPGSQKLWPASLLQHQNSSSTPEQRLIGHYCITVNVKV